MQRIESKRNFLAKLLSVAALPTLLKTLSAGHVMTTGPVSVEPQTSAGELMTVFYEMRFRHLLVTENGLLVGVISDRDVGRLFGINGSANPRDLQRLTARDLMSTDLITVEPHTPLSEAVRRIVDHGINCLPVVHEGIPLGILTTTDLYLALEQLLESARSLAEVEPAASL
jgi:acetoin utilization protein AcuB